MGAEVSTHLLSELWWRQQWTEVVVDSCTAVISGHPIWRCKLVAARSETLVVAAIGSVSLVIQESQHSIE